MGEALGFPDLPRPQTARPRRGRPVQGHPRHHRHGQLPSREAGGTGYPASRPGRGSRSRPHRRWRPEARSGAGPALQHPQEFNDRFGNIEWKDQDKIEKVIAEDLPRKVAEDRAYRNAIANSDRQNARIEHDKALERAMTDVLADHTELFKQFSDNESFRRWLSEMVFAATYSGSSSTASPAIAT